MTSWDASRGHRGRPTTGSDARWPPSLVTGNVTHQVATVRDLDSEQGFCVPILDSKSDSVSRAVSGR
jgi:hypothetical protein